MIALFFWIPHIKDRASAKKKINIKDQNHWIKDQSAKCNCYCYQCNDHEL